MGWGDPAAVDARLAETNNGRWRVVVEADDGRRLAHSSRLFDDRHQAAAWWVERLQWWRHRGGVWTLVPTGLGWQGVIGEAGDPLLVTDEQAGHDGGEPAGTVVRTVATYLREDGTLSE